MTMTDIKSELYVKNVLSHSGLSPEFVPILIEADYDWVEDPNDYTDKTSALIRMEKKEMLDLLLDLHSPARVWITIGKRFLGMFFDAKCADPGNFKMYLGMRADRWSLVAVCSGPKDEPYTKNMFIKQEKI